VKKHQVKWTRQALDDISDIQEYIAIENHEAAYKVTCTIQNSIEKISLFPKIGKKGRVNDTQEMVVPSIPYIIAYTHDATTIYLLAIMHTSRKWPDFF